MQLTCSDCWVLTRPQQSKVNIPIITNFHVTITIFDKFITHKWPLPVKEIAFWIENVVVTRLELGGMVGAAIGLKQASYFEREMLYVKTTDAKERRLQQFTQTGMLI